MTIMPKEQQSIELINLEINKIKVGAGIGLDLIAFLLLLLSFFEYSQPVKIILKFSPYILGGIGGALIGLGVGGQKYKSQWIKKRD